MILHGDCLEQMKTLDENSVDAIVTDPPYGLSFMGKAWDYEVPSTDIWKEAFRVLKPGGHLLSFFGTRTYHRGVVRIEDAGFEIRDQIMWIYGSGFPKSHNVDKSIDKMMGAEREVLGQKDVGPDMNNGAYNNASADRMIMSITCPASELAKQWQGWGTALKPANEPIVVARKPLEKGLTIAQNVLKYGTGALNIDESRIETDEKLQASTTKLPKYGGSSYFESITMAEPSKQNPQGRWPANILFDEAAAETLPIIQNDSVSRYFYVAKASKRERNAGLEGLEVHRYGAGLGQGKTPEAPTVDKNHHPTVKPIKLMEYLIKLVTPPKGIVLDPFMGSGSTGVAAKNLGFNFIGCEMNAEYIEIAKRRIG